VSTVAVGSGAVRDVAGRAALQECIAHLEDENAALREEQRRLEDEQQRVEAERERLGGENQRLRAEGERLREANERLRAEVEALRRAGKRQAAPFSRDDPTPDPKRAGRKSGAAHGRHAHRQPPERVDRVVAVGLPGGCPGCGGELVLERVAAQHVEDLPEPRPLRIRYQVQVGRCRSCGLRVQPRHSEQTSDALGAAGAQLGPRQWRWRPGSARDWGCRPPRSPGCWASLGCASLLVGSRERSPGPLAAPSPPTSR